jgi:hypothetical protein
VGNKRVDFEHIDEFFAAREAAYDGLRRGAFVGAVGSPFCRFVVLPSFENSVAWDVRSTPVPGKPAELRLFRSCWRMDLDLHALGSPVERLKHPRPYRPTVEVGAAPIDAASIQELVRRLQNIPVSLSVANPPSGCDGTNYELEIGHFFCHARIAWWVCLPEEWAALGPVVKEMVALFESSWRDA